MSIRHQYPTGETEAARKLLAIGADVHALSKQGGSDFSDRDRRQAKTLQINKSIYSRNC